MRQTVLLVLAQHLVIFSDYIQDVIWRLVLLQQLRMYNIRRELLLHRLVLFLYKFKTGVEALLLTTNYLIFLLVQQHVRLQTLLLTIWRLVAQIQLIWIMVLMEPLTLEMQHSITHMLTQMQEPTQFRMLRE